MEESTVDHASLHAQEEAVLQAPTQGGGSTSSTDGTDDFDKTTDISSAATDLELLNLNEPEKASALPEQHKSETGREVTDPDDDDLHSGSDRRMTTQYILDNEPMYSELENLRLKGWNNPQGDEFFKRQRYFTDNADRDTSMKFLKMMQQVAEQMERATGIFTLPGPRPTVLGFGFAPGGFVQKALMVNPNVRAIGVTLPDKVSGIPVLIQDRRLTVVPADIALMAGDLGMLPDEIPSDHPDAEKFLSKQIRPCQQFDLVTCEGGVLRPHLVQAGSHREQGETQRLKAAQLALALSRVKAGGKMIVLMHKAETWNSLSLFYIFSKFAKIDLFKPEGPHQFKSSFYMIATDVQSHSEEARAAIKMWTKEWKLSTFGTHEEWLEEVGKNALDVKLVLDEFGPKWIELSRGVWKTQLEGLKAKSFTRDSSPRKATADADGIFEPVHATQAEA